MTQNDAASNLTGRGIGIKRADDGSLLFPLGDGTTRATIRGTVTFDKGGDNRLASVEFVAEGEAASAQFVSWLHQTSGRYGASRARSLTGSALTETFCYSKELAVQLRLSDRKAELIYATNPDELRACAGATARRDVEALAYQVGPPATPPADLLPARSAPNDTATRTQASRPGVSKAEQAALEQRYADLGYCHGLYLRLSELEVLPMPRRRMASEAMGRVREQGRGVQRQLGYSDEVAEQTFGANAARRLTSNLRSQQDFTRAVSDCKAKNAA